MTEDEFVKLIESLGQPGPKEGVFFQDRMALCLGADLNREGGMVRMQGPIFIDFEASSLSMQSWPIEVGIAWIEDAKSVVVESKLIKPRPEWPEEDWSPESQEIHGISRHELDCAEPADAVAKWVLEKAIGRLLTSNAPEFDQRWLNRLLCKPGPKIADFDRVLWAAFSREDGVVKPGRLSKAYKNMQRRKIIHRAGDDAANLAYAWRAGLGK